MSFPKQVNLYSVTSGTPGTLSAADSCFLFSASGSWTLPAISGMVDGAMIFVKNTTSAGASVTLTPSGTDTINGGNAAHIILTSTNGSVGQGAILVASKAGGDNTWWIIANPN
jgi:hypothetical protein